MLLVVHMLLGYRPLRHLNYYRDDPLVRRVLGLRRLPEVSTLTRHLSSFDERSIGRIEGVQQALVLEQLAHLKLARVTLDFDGSVISSTRHAEGLAMGWNRRKKGQRSYYPLLCMVAQTAQVLAVKHRSGNVHDSNGAKAFILACIARVRSVVPEAAIEVRVDSAFFSEETVLALEGCAVHYSISVPVERYTAIKQQIDERRRWQPLGEAHGYFERRWGMASWRRHNHRFLFIRSVAWCNTKHRCS